MLEKEVHLLTASNLPLPCFCCDLGSLPYLGSDLGLGSVIGVE
jgi:hypothetical protein